ncbi:uncharacterized protein BO95DRAFT_512802 [Aspergillus brunneoviolaceus CBS 621.78]|uniref:Uncharacterized protein n=1 Tax=Aspergillus brunneoviolaceus CBS 621.78 TaxID=1450534 RepID=A0ACD1GFA5_9EURO|nr:hypothetical protein BO95DRAFT_512802 [Aspergillus brunneoviolaceus CBS 621.78]RAH47897.1 hypothetical protein BO95DRAFT_512802 [Aspergillus brunneoviolaceus CBS 621.78]
MVAPASRYCPEHRPAAEQQHPARQPVFTPTIEELLRPSLVYDPARPVPHFSTTDIFQVLTLVEKEGDLSEHLSIDAIKRSLPKTARKVRSNTKAAGDACPWHRLEHLSHAYVKSIDTRPGAVARGLGMVSAVRIWKLVFQKEQFMFLMRDWLPYRHQWFGIRDILDSQNPARGKPRQWNKFLGKEIQAQANIPELWREWARDERPGTVHPILDHLIPEILKGEVFLCDAIRLAHWFWNDYHTVSRFGLNAATSCSLLHTEPSLPSTMAKSSSPFRRNHHAHAPSVPQTEPSEELHSTSLARLRSGPMHDLVVAAVRPSQISLQRDGNAAVKLSCPACTSKYRSKQPQELRRQLLAFLYSHHRLYMDRLGRPLPSLVLHQINPVFSLSDYHWIRVILHQQLKPPRPPAFLLSSRRSLDLGVSTRRSWAPAEVKVHLQPAPEDFPQLTGKSSPDVPQVTAVLVRSCESLPVAYEADNLFDFVEARRVVEKRLHRHLLRQDDPIQHPGGLRLCRGHERRHLSAARGLMDSVNDLSKTGAGFTRIPILMANARTPILIPSRGWQVSPSDSEEDNLTLNEFVERATAIVTSRNVTEVLPSIGVLEHVEKISMPILPKASQKKAQGGVTPRH